MNDKEDAQIKLSRMFIGGAFRGYALTVDGKMLSNQVSTVIDTEPDRITRVTASFIISNQMIIDAPDIYLKDGI